jgi:predicted nuclease of predicted toxin-antitoxin system
VNKPRFLADENIAALLVAALREAGWDTAYVMESKPGITDDAVLEWARVEERILLTEDKDFGELVFRLKRSIPGVLMLRMLEGQWHRHWERLQIVLQRHANRLEGTFTVVQSDNVRFRPIVR